MSSDKAGSSQLRMSGFSSHASIPSATPPPARAPSLSLGICTGGAGTEEQLVVGSEDGHRSVRRARKNKQAALRSRARKEAYTQELEKEVQVLLHDNLKLERQCKQEQEDVAGGSRQLAAEPERLQLQHHPPTCSTASLSLGVGTGGEEQLAVSSEDGHRSVRARKNKQPTLRSRARKKAYTQELEKEVQGLLQDNLKLKRQLQSEIDALGCQQPSNKQSSPLRVSVMDPSERSIPVSQAVVPRGGPKGSALLKPMWFWSRMSMSEYPS